MRTLSWSFLVAGALAAGCSTGTPSTEPGPPAQVIDVTVAPTTATVSTGASATFVALVTGTANGAVGWSVAEGSACGSVSAAGVYTAPAAAGTCHVVATSAADGTRSATATVIVSATPLPVAVAISPASPNVQAGGSIAFTATVTNTTSGQSTAVTWSVSSGGGTINAATGAYVAPATAGSYAVTATSVADSSRSASVTVTVTASSAAVQVTVSPATASLDACGSATFSASVANTSDTRVTWSVAEVTGGSVTGGAYVAPTAAGTYHVVATSVVDPTRSAQATVTVGPEKVLKVAVVPSSGTVGVSGALQLAATVTTSCGSFTAQ